MAENGDFKALREFLKFNGKSPKEIQRTLSNENIFSYKIYIRLQPTCVLKKVRLFIIFRELSEIGHISFTNPEFNLLEAGDFKKEFEIFFISPKKDNEILEILESILEIENKYIQKISKEEFLTLYKNSLPKVLRKEQKNEIGHVKSKKKIIKEIQSVKENSTRVLSTKKHEEETYKTAKVKTMPSMEKMIFLTDMQKDGLQEIGNIGAGNAANALARLINRRVDINIPLVQIIELDKYFNKISKKNHKLFVSWSNIKGDNRASILIIFGIYDIIKLVSILIEGMNNNEKKVLEKDVETIEDFPELYTSAFSELVHILTNHYTIALGKLLDLNLMTTPPGTSIDGGDQLNKILNDEIGLFTGLSLLITTDIVIRDIKIIGTCIFIPEPETIENLLEALSQFL
ncbi:MAG: chemotaxis protein CheC [Promethearchaeota archaeon]